MMCLCVCVCVPELACVALFVALVAHFISVLCLLLPNTQPELCCLKKNDVPASGHREGEGADRSDQHSEDAGVLLHRTPV